MRNPLTIKIEFSLAISFVLGLTLFYGLIIFKTIKNFEAELKKMESQRTEINFNR